MTPVLKPVDPATATGKTKELFDAIEYRLKRVPGMIRLMPNSPSGPSFSLLSKLDSARPKGRS